MLDTHLSKNTFGIFAVDDTTDSGGEDFVTVRLLHRSGEWNLVQGRSTLNPLVLAVTTR